MIRIYQTKKWTESFIEKPILEFLEKYVKKLNIDHKKNYFQDISANCQEDYYLSLDSKIYPHQDYDSGAFVCTCAEFLSRGELKPVFNQNYIFEYRHKIMYEVIHDTFL